MKSCAIVSQKKTRTLGIRLTDAEIVRFNGFAAETGIPIAEMVRRLLDAAREYFYENDGWPREIAVVKKRRGGAEALGQQTKAPVAAGPGARRAPGLQHAGK